MVLKETKRHMKKKQLLLAVGIVGLIAAYFVWNNFLKTAPPMKRLDADYQVEATQLYSAYDANEETADLKYLNKVIEVTGVVQNIETPENSLPVVSLKTNGFGVVKCTMEAPLNDNELKLIRLDTPITFRAECIGSLLDVMLIRAIILEQ